MDTNIYRRTSNRTQLCVANSDLSALYFDLEGLLRLEEAILEQPNAEKDGRNSHRLKHLKGLSPKIAL